MSKLNKEALGATLLELVGLRPDCQDLVFEIVRRFNARYPLDSELKEAVLDALYPNQKTVDKLRERAKLLASEGKLLYYPLFNHVIDLAKRDEPTSLPKYSLIDFSMVDCPGLHRGISELKGDVFFTPSQIFAFIDLVLRKEFKSEIMLPVSNGETTFFVGMYYDGDRECASVDAYRSTDQQNYFKLARVLYKK